jgi:hypothetical protein
MSLISLRRTLTPNATGVGFLYSALTEYYDTERRKPYATRTDSQVNDPFELTRGDEVYRYEYRPGRVRQVLYNGNGSVYTKNLTGAAVSSLLVKADTTTPYTESDGSADASVDLTGTLGQPPYQLVLVGTLGTPSASYRQTATSYSENYPVRFYNLPQGEYVAQVIDALGYQSFLGITVAPGSRQARGVQVLEQRTVLGTILFRWRFNERDIKRYSAAPAQPGTTILPYGTYVDGFLLNAATWRQIYSDGKGGVYPIDTATAANTLLELDNIIQFNPDTPGGLGGFIVEMNATALPLTFAVAGQTNQTGRFDGLPASNYPVQVTDAAGRQLTVPVLLACRYGLRWVLAFSDKDGRPVRVELWLLDYTGEPETLIGDADPVVLKSDGLNSENGGQGDVPPVVGTSCELRFRVPAATFEQVLTADEFYCRTDVYYSGQLEFRGYVQPALSNPPLLAGAQAIALTATDGLAQLKDAAMLGHVGQRLYGHRPMLHTLLHCLSRTNVALPLEVFVNRRDATMSDADAPEEAATTNRTGYWDEQKNDPVPQREALDGLAQALGGTLCQRGGTWQLRSALEAGADAPGRAYLAAGTPAGARTAPAPTNAIRPPRRGDLCWLEAEQAQQVRAGWKSLKGATDVGWLKNAFPAGAVFSDKNAWLPDYSRLRPLAGWHPAPGSNFPLLFTRAGDKGTDYATEWPRSLDKSLSDSRYLESPLLPLAAGTEAVPAYLSFSGKLVPTEYYKDLEGNTVVSPTTASKAVLAYEVFVDGQGTGRKLAELKQVASSSAKDVTFEAPLPALPSTAGGAVLRVHSWIAPDNDYLTSAPVVIPGSLQYFAKGTVVRHDFGTGTYRLFVALVEDARAGAFLLDVYKVIFAEITATNTATGQLLISSIGIQLRPQQATWEGEDNFRADGPGGTERPTEVLKVYHPDPPLSAGLFGGNLLAFGRGVGLLDGTQPTSWARAIDLAATPLFESNVLDGLALRAGASRLLTGPLAYQAQPPRLLDSLDTPDDVPGRRFMVAATEWHLKKQFTAVSLVEIGPGADAPDPLLELPEGVRVTHEVYQYTPGKFTAVVRVTQDGRVRVRLS